MSSSQETRARPDKNNIYSHVHDALQSVILYIRNNNPLQGMMRTDMEANRGEAVGSSQAGWKYV